MSMRIVLAAVLMLALNLGASAALAQKTLTKAEAAPPTTAAQPAAGTLDPDALQKILDEAEAASFPPEGQAPDDQRAFELYSRGAEAGDAYAMHNLGIFYQKGEYVAQDYPKAFAWHLRAAEAGVPEAQFQVGDMYLTARGVEQSYPEALRWFRLAAGNGNDFAMFRLGSMYLNGTGVTKDPKEAVAWLQQASDAGLAVGHWSLSLRYIYGDGVDKDPQKAAELGYLALTMGEPNALREIKDVPNSITPPKYRRALQELLKRDGFYSGAIDGDFGPGTQKAIDAAFNSAS